MAQIRAAAARADHNLMPNLLDCARVHASEGEMVAALQEVFGTYTEPQSSDACRQAAFERATASICRTRYSLASSHSRQAP